MLDRLFSRRQQLECLALVSKKNVLTSYLGVGLFTFVSSLTDKVTTTSNT